MDSLRFIHKYEDYLTEIGQVIKPELLPILQEMSETDPHDLVRPDTFFIDESHAQGFVWASFIERTRKRGIGK